MSAARVGLFLASRSMIWVTLVGVQRGLFFMRRVGTPSAVSRLAVLQNERVSPNSAMTRSTGSS